MDPKQPLGLPPGSVRSLLALMLTGAAIWTVVAGAAVPEWYIGLVGLAIGEYFGRRGSSEE